MLSPMPLSNLICLFLNNDVDRGVWMHKYQQANSPICCDSFLLPGEDPRRLAKAACCATLKSLYQLTVFARFAASILDYPRSSEPGDRKCKRLKHPCYPSQYPLICPRIFKPLHYRKFKTKKTPLAKLPLVPIRFTKTCVWHKSKRIASAAYPSAYT